ncbi:MAG: DUF4442 domain-containing protein [Desulfobacteraceae bacterium]
MKLTPGLLKAGLNLYGPYLGAGIRVRHISRNWKKVHVSMKLKWFNRNIMKVHFGGSLYAMVDPHLMLMLMQVLGQEYQVWDKSAEIEFVKPGMGTVYSILEILDQDLAAIKKETGHGEKYFHSFDVSVKDEQGDQVARVKKILYIKRKRAG